MTKQKEIGEGKYYVPASNQPVIQEGIAVWLYGASTNPFKEPDWKELPDWRKDQYRKNAYFLMVKLDGMGVVIKVDRDNKTCECCEGIGTIGGKGIRDCCPECNGTGKMYCVGYTAWEPLIKEVKDEN